MMMLLATIVRRFLRKTRQRSGDATILSNIEDTTSVPRLSIFSIYDWKRNSNFVTYIKKKKEKRKKKKKRTWSISRNEPCSRIVFPRELVAFATFFATRSICDFARLWLSSFGQRMLYSWINCVGKIILILRGWINLFSVTNNLNVSQ